MVGVGLSKAWTVLLYDEVRVDRVDMVPKACCKFFFAHLLTFCVLAPSTFRAPRSTVDCDFVCFTCAPHQGIVRILERNYLRDTVMVDPKNVAAI